MAHQLENLNRRAQDLHQPLVAELLPEHFVEDYPNLVQFLQYYYDFVREYDPHNFDKEIYLLNSLRDTQQTPEKYLDKIIYEIGSRLRNGENFTDPQFASQFLAELYRVKGSRNSIEAFFRLFFQTDAYVTYPKNEIFVVGEDFIGPEAIRYIQDYKRYQTYSIFIKVGLGISQYRELYKKFIHPAGWYFEGEAAVEGIANVFLTTPVALVDSDVVAFAQVVNMPILTADEMTGIYSTSYHYVPLSYNLDSTNNGSISYSGSRLDEIINQPISYLDSAYTIREFLTPNSMTFDDSDLAGRTVDFSFALETFDDDMHTRYLSDSNY